MWPNVTKSNRILGLSLLHACRTVMRLIDWRRFKQRPFILITVTSPTKLIFFWAKISLEFIYQNIQPIHWYVQIKSMWSKLTLLPSILEQLSCRTSIRQGAFIREGRLIQTLKSKGGVYKTEGVYLGGGFYWIIYCNKIIHFNVNTERLVLYQIFRNNWRFHPEKNYVNVL